MTSFSAPKGVERACPGRAAALLPVCVPGVSVPRRALRGHAPLSLVWLMRCLCSFSAPKGVERACPRFGPGRCRWRSWVSVPRRALRGHAPRKGAGGITPWSRCFSAPKGVERACPARRCQLHDLVVQVSVPRRALRGHAPPNPFMSEYEFLWLFQCPEGR